MTVAIGSTAMMMAMHPESFILGIQHLNNWSLQSAATWIQQIPKEALIFTGFVSTDMVLLSELMALKSVDSTDAAIVYTMEPVRNFATPLPLITYFPSGFGGPVGLSLLRGEMGSSWMGGCLVDHRIQFCHTSTTL